jgi:hypothetical protein
MTPKKAPPKFTYGGRRARRSKRLAARTGESESASEIDQVDERMGLGDEESNLSSGQGQDLANLEVQSVGENVSISISS